MYKNAKNYEKSMIISSLCTVILGLVLAILPGTSIKIFTTTIAIILLILGGFMLGTYVKSTHEEKISSSSLVIAIILFALSLFLLINNESLASFITTIIGLFISIKALFKIQFAVNIRKISVKWKYNLLIGLLTLTLGIVILINPFNSAQLFLRIIGIIMVICSLIEVIETFMVLKNIKESDKVIEATFVDKEDNNEQE